MAEETEMLIEQVRKYVYLFDTSHELYKNIVKKAEAWNKIAEELNITSDSAKTKWKNLRDSYMRYKKCIQGATGQAAKYHKWPWSSNLEFLDDTIKYRPQSSNVIQSEKPREKTPPLIQNLQENNESTEKSPSSSRMPPPSNPHKKQKIRHATSIPESTDVDRVIEYLENKKKPMYNGIDYLFLSYADTFKKFRPKTQAELKIKIATLFAQTEMEELLYEQNNSTSSSNSSQYCFEPQSSSNTVHYNTSSEETSCQSDDISLSSARDFYENSNNYSIVELLGLPTNQ